MMFRGSSLLSMRRRGFGLVEMAISGLMVAAALAMTIHIVGWVATERRAVARRERALAEAANLMERIAARPHGEITEDYLKSLQLPEAARSTLPGSSLTAKIDENSEAPASRRVTLEIRWMGRSGQPESPVRLVYWSYPKGGTAR